MGTPSLTDLHGFFFDERGKVISTFQKLRLGVILATVRLFETTYDNPFQPLRKLNRFGEMDDAQNTVLKEEDEPLHGPTIAVSASRRPTHYHHLVKQYLRSHTNVHLVAMESAIAVSIDTALLLERHQLVRIERCVCVFQIG